MCINQVVVHVWCVQLRGVTNLVDAVRLDGRVDELSHKFTLEVLQTT